MSRLRASSSIKDSSKTSSCSKDQFRDEQDDPSFASYKNGSNRYHFGMATQRDDEASKNGRNCRDHSNVDPGILYQKSKEHFGSWDIKDIAPDDSPRPRKQTDRLEDSRLTNGRSNNHFARQDRYDDRDESRNDRGRAASIDRDEAGSYPSRKKESWDGTESSKTPSKFGRSKNEKKDDSQRNDERDQLLREIESLAVDGRSPDRRIRAMIERFKPREEDNAKPRNEYDSLSPDREGHRSRSGGRSEARIDHVSDANDRDRGRGRMADREDERKTSRSKIREVDKFEQEECGRSRSRDRRTEKCNDKFSDKKNDSHGSEKNRRRSKEIEDDAPRRKESPKRRSYVYDGNPEDFDVRIQRYERALLEPRRDLESSRRVSLKDSDADSGRKESLKDSDRQVSRKSSFKSTEPKKSHSRDREAGLGRKASFKDQENGVQRRNSFKGQDIEKKYFGRDPEHVSRKSMFREHGYDAGRKNSLKEQSSDYGRISLKNRDEEDERKRSLKGHTDGVSRITFKERDAQVSFKEHPSDIGRKNSFKEKTVEFAGVSYKDRDDDTDRSPFYKTQDNEPSKTSFQSYAEPRKMHSPNGRYVEFGSVSVHRDEDELRASPLNDDDYNLERRSSCKERDPSSKGRTASRGKSHEGVDKRLDRHCRPLTPPKREEPEHREDQNARDEFNSKSWYESNRTFAAAYLRENSRHRANPEGGSEVERDPSSPEMRIHEPQDRQHSNERFGNEIQEPKRNSTSLEAYNFGAADRSRDLDSRYASSRERNGATIIRIRSSPETPVERRRRRRPVQETHAGRRRRYDAEDEGDSEEDEEDDHRQRTPRADGFISGRGVPTPSRRVWNYREGGVLITDVEEGQPCLQCGDTCPGFSPHTWRCTVNCLILNDKLQRRHTTPTLLSASGPRMSPKGPSQEGPKMEVRVSCVPSPGAEPQGIRVKIPEPKKRPMSPPLIDAIRSRCPSVPEKDFYRKTSSLDRRDRYPTLSGAEIKRGLIPGNGDAPRGRRNPMLDRKNRFPTISGAELKRSVAIGKCPLEDGLDLSLAPWPGMKLACVRVLHLYCKVFDQFELFELIVRKNCTSCKCPREAHGVCHEEWVSVRSRLGLKGDDSTSPVSFHPRAVGLAWAPPGLPAHKVEEYFSMLPEVSVPRLGTPGERYRDRQLAIQLPKQDLARAYCRHLNPKHASSADDFMAARNEIALDIGSVQEVLERDIGCGACHSPLKYGGLAVSASKLGLQYHPPCFRCSECKELLVDLAYCVHEDTLFCERHYAEQLKPRCAACDELIFSGEYTKAMNKDWHSGHFCCWQCDESLTGQRYVLRDEHPYCIKCYESVFANGCEECNKIIGIDSKDLSYKDKHWHEACFLCNRCRVSLVDKQFGSKVDKIYCGNCYDAQFASRCDGCGEIFRAGTKKMEYKTRQWHEKCFCCVVCKNAIGTKSFIPREQEIYCASCYEDKFATRCVKCNKIINSGGVTYKNEPWHRDCFTCSNCNNSLAGQRFTSRDDKPYCADCFGELFAKRCTACTKPITGIGGTRFISFEDRHWHNDCFICAGCKTSLVGRGFIADGEDIICPDCAKTKLM